MCLPRRRSSRSVSRLTRHPEPRRRRPISPPGVSASRQIHRLGRQRRCLHRLRRWPRRQRSCRRCRRCRASCSQIRYPPSRWFRNQRRRPRCCKRHRICGLQSRHHLRHSRRTCPSRRLQRPCRPCRVCRASSLTLRPWRLQRLPRPRQRLRRWRTAWCRSQGSVWRRRSRTRCCRTPPGLSMSSAPPGRAFRTRRMR